ncbi:MAG: beta-ketoacyl synthase, partial [Comamonadaceae bacterium]
GLGLVDTAPVWPTRAPDFNGEDHLALTRAVGLSYGPAYTAVVHGWQESERTVIAKLQADASISQELAGAHLHPALLDCTFQLIIQLLKHDPSMGTGSAFVPAKIGRVIARAGEHRVSGVRATVLRRTPHALVARFSLFDQDGVQIAVIEEARFRSVRLHKNPLEQLSFPDYLAVPAPRHAVHQHPLPSFEMADLVHGLQAISQQPALADTASRFASEVEPLADALSIQFVREALLSFADAQGQLSSGAVQALRTQHPDQATLLNALLARLVDDGSARATSTGWTLTIDADQPPAIDIWNSLLRDYPDYFAIVQAIGRVGQHLPHLISHDRNLADTVPREATPAALAAHVQGLAVRQDLSRYLTSFALRVQERLASGARLGILEIGTAAPLMGLEACGQLDPHLTHYAFASADADALATARRQMENHPDALVIDLTATGTDDVSHADLVVLDIGLMSLEDARRSLGFAYQNLAPRGALLLVNSYPAFWLDMIFGAEPTWWAEASDGGRVSRQQAPAFWQAELQALGLR